MLRDIIINIWLCTFTLGGSVKPHILVHSTVDSNSVLTNTSLMAVQLTFELELRRIRYKNGKNGTVITVFVVSKLY